jgi:hypothetical protein
MSCSPRKPYILIPQSFSQVIDMKGLKGWPFEPIKCTAPYTSLGDGAGSGKPC